MLSQTMKGQRFGKCIVLCLLPWNCLSFAWSDAGGPGTTSLGAGHVRKGLPRDAANGTDVQSNISGTEVSDFPALPLRAARGPRCRHTGGRAQGRGDEGMMVVLSSGTAALPGHAWGPQGFVWWPQQLLLYGRDAERKLDS